MLDLHPLSPGFGVEAFGVDLANPLTDAAFADIERAFFARQVLVLRAQYADAGAVPRLRAPLRAAAAARDRPVPSSRRPEHPDPVQREEERKADRAAGCRHVLPHRLFVSRQVPARATTLYSSEVPAHGGDTLFANQ